MAGESLICCATVELKYETNLTYILSFMQLCLKNQSRQRSWRDWLKYGGSFGSEGQKSGGNVSSPRGGISMFESDATHAHLHTSAHTGALQWWRGPERLISHHEGKLKARQLSLSPSSVSCCLQASTPCCVFFIQPEIKEHLKSKFRSLINIMDSSLETKKLKWWKSETYLERLQPILNDKSVQPI